MLTSAPISPMKTENGAEFGIDAQQKAMKKPIDESTAAKEKRASLSTSGSTGHKILEYFRESRLSHTCGKFLAITSLLLGVGGVPLCMLAFGVFNHNVLSESSWYEWERVLGVMAICLPLAVSIVAGLPVVFQPRSSEMPRQFRMWVKIGWASSAIWFVLILAVSTQNHV